KPLFQERETIMTPEGLTAEHEERHAEDVIGRGFFLAMLVSLASLAGEVIDILLRREPDAAEQPRHCLGLIGLEFAQEELLESGAPVIEQAAMLLRKQAADGRRSGVINLERPAYPQPARFGEAPRVHIGVLDLVFRRDAALALALDAQLKR